MVNVIYIFYWAPAKYRHLLIPDQSAECDIHSESLQEGNRERERDCEKTRWMQRSRFMIQMVL